MKLRNYPLKNIKKNSKQVTITILGISLAMLTILCMKTAVGYLDRSIENYFRPLKDFNIVIESDGNMVQFIPIDSYIDNETIENITNSFPIDFYPTYFKFLNETIKSIIPNILVGFDIEFLEKILSYFQNYEGRLPLMNENEIFVGNSWQIETNPLVLGDQVTLFEKNFTVVGIIDFQNPILNNFLISSYQTLNSEFNLNGTVNALFYDVDENSAIYQQEIESNFTSLKVLDEEEIDQISQDVSIISIEWNETLSIFSMFTSFSFTLVIFLINLKKKRKNLQLLETLGTNSFKIYLFEFFEFLLIISIGSLLGYFLSIFIYPSISLVGLNSQGVDYNPLKAYIGGFLYNLPDLTKYFIEFLPYMLLFSWLIFFIPYFMLIKKNRKGRV